MEYGTGSCQGRAAHTQDRPGPRDHASAQNGFDYHSIPLERMAYDLDGRFSAAPGTPFSVRDEVTRRLSSP
jgi:hypothetical protein